MQTGVLNIRESVASVQLVIWTQ